MITLQVERADHSVEALLMAVLAAVWAEMVLLAGVPSIPQGAIDMATPEALGRAGPSWPLHKSRAFRAAIHRERVQIMDCELRSREPV